MRYQGRLSVSLKVIAVYCPYLSDGPHSTYSQHVNHLYDQDDDRCPQQAFPADLQADVAKCIQAGKQVVVMLDANSNVRDGDVNQTFSALGMREVLLEFNETFLRRPLLLGTSDTFRSILSLLHRR